jgi:hypothetical protein
LYQPYESTPFSDIIKLNEENVKQFTLQYKDGDSMQIPFLSGLFRTGDKPRNYYIGTDFRYLFGPSAGGKTVNEFTAMQTTAVYACTEYFVKE